MAAIFRLSSLIRISFATIAVFQLAACTPVPTPFKGADRNWDIIQSITDRPNVAIARIEGLPPPLDQQIADRIADAAQRRDVAATSRGASQSHGWLRGNASAPSGAKKISIDWIMSDADGSELDRFSTSIPIYDPTKSDPWLRFANSDYTSAIETTATRLASVFETGSPPPLIAEQKRGPQQASVAQSPYFVHITTIKGAPGDGPTSLKEALGAILSDPRLIVPITIANSPTSKTYLIDAQINLRNKSADTQSIRLNWRLLSPTGEVLGNVAQQNDIPMGSLNGPWNEIAFYAAEAAAEGLVNLLMLAKPVPDSPQTAQ